jgi:hypothetical protein
MLTFDTRGNLKPYQPIQSSVTEMKKYLVDQMRTSDTRIENYVRYRKYATALKRLLPDVELKQWINGSFVTRKTNPKDIDLITFIDHSQVKRLGTKLDDFRPERSWDVFEVDAYILEVYPEKSQYYNFTQSDVAYWLDQFGHARVNRRGQKHPKGFLEIIS